MIRNCRLSVILHVKFGIIGLIHVIAIAFNLLVILFICNDFIIFQIMSYTIIELVYLCSHIGYIITYLIDVTHFYFINLVLMSIIFDITFSSIEMREIHLLQLLLELSVEVTFVEVIKLIHF